MARRVHWAWSARILTMRASIPACPYDPLTDFEPVAFAAGVPNLMVLNPKNVKATDVQAKGLPQDIRAKLVGALDKSLRDDNIRKRLLDLGGVIPEALGRGPHALQKLVENEVARWQPVLKAANAVANWSSQAAPVRSVGTAGDRHRAIGPSTWLGGFQLAGAEAIPRVPA